jgi:hypothetical protein
MKIDEFTSVLEKEFVLYSSKCIISIPSVNDVLKNVAPYTENVVACATYLSKMLIVVLIRMALILVRYSVVSEILMLDLRLSVEVSRIMAREEMLRRKDRCDFNFVVMAYIMN